MGKKLKVQIFSLIPKLKLSKKKKKKQFTGVPTPNPVITSFLEPESRLLYWEIHMYIVHNIIITYIYAANYILHKS